MDPIAFDRMVIQASIGGTPVGYVLPNGVVIVWSEGRGQNNFANLQAALAQIPTLRIIERNR